MNGDVHWFYWAVQSASFMALTAIFAKVGIAMVAAGVMVLSFKR